jgi:acyl-CoA thioesterase-1
VNAGVSGDTTSGGLARIQSVLGLQPAIVIVELGGNDGLRGLPVSASRSNLEQIIVTLQKAGIRVVLAGMTLPPNYGADYIREFEKMYKDLAATYRTPRIPFLLEGVATLPELMQPDQIHPTSEGNQRVAANVMEVLDPLLEKQ